MDPLLTEVNYLDAETPPVIEEIEVLENRIAPQSSSNFLD